MFDMNRLLLGGKSGNQRRGDIAQMRVQQNRAIARRPRQHAMKLADRGDPCGDAIQHHADFGVGERFGGLGGRPGLHPDQSPQ